MRKLIMATDGSDGAMGALAFGVQLAKAFEAELCLINVTQDMGLSHKELQQFSRTETVTLGGALTTQAHQILATAKSRALELGARRLHTEAAIGDPAGVILNSAERDGADAIIVGKRGCGALHRMLLGSVSQKLTSLAPCPVIIVP